MATLEKPSFSGFMQIKLFISLQQQGRERSPKSATVTLFFICFSLCVYVCAPCVSMRAAAVKNVCDRQSLLLCICV